MILAPTVAGILHGTPENPRIRVRCPECDDWHDHPTTADMRPGDLTHVMPRCDNRHSRYRDTGYYVRISRHPYRLTA